MVLRVLRCWVLKEGSFSVQAKETLNWLLYEADSSTDKIVFQRLIQAGRVLPCHCSNILVRPG